MFHMKILILTTEENFKWTSMQEIIPSIENLWLGLNSSEITVERICVDDLNLKEHIPRFLAADKFVVTAFNLKIVRAFEVIKKVLNHSGQTFFYVHNMATIGCWPLNFWKFSDLLTTNDVFVVSCKRDISSLKSNYENCRSILTPFTYTDHVANTKKIKVEKDEDADFVFVGRVSAQKNLHSLIWGFSHFIKKNKTSSKLIIYGKEDDLGSPNMGMDCANYMDHLKALVTKLELTERVIFKGFVAREVISEDLARKDHIMVSPSLHSDENFGMAAFKYLISGKRCILSDWGGHSDYISSFSDQLELIAVKDSDLGPVVSAMDINRAMENISSKNNYEPHFPVQYSLESIHETLLSALAYEQEASKLIIHSHSKGILDKQEEYASSTENKFNERIFEDYKDLLSKEFFSHYGMIERSREELFDRNLYQLAPWLEIKKSTLVGHDFHKGAISVELDKGTFPIIDLSGTKKNISKELISKLVELGYAYLSNLDLDVDRFKEDRCGTSIEILKEKVESFFSAKGIKNLYFPDANDSFPKNQEVVNVVLFGGYLKRFLESGCWCFENMHFWVLSPSVKDILTAVCGLPKESISVIERSNLFNINSSMPLELSGEIDFVYAGRISRVKNIELLVQTVYHLQRDYDLNIRLNLIGHFEDAFHEYWGYFTETSYEKEIISLIEELDWKYESPRIQGPYLWSEWPELDYKRPHYISFSSFLSEDFSVSVAQAQEKGWPCILSDWGAHRDIYGAQLLPMNYIVPFLKKNSLSKVYAKRLASYIFNNQKSLNHAPSPSKGIESKNISLDELDSTRREFVKRWGSEVLSLTSDEGWKFASSEKGQIFYREVIQHLGRFTQRQNVILVQEGLNEVFSVSKELSSKFENIKELEEFEIISATEVLQKRYLKKLISCENIFVSFDQYGCEKLISTIENLVGRDKIIFLGEEKNV